MPPGWGSEILGFEGSEAAEILDLEPAAFRKRLSRARERVREAVSRNCGIVGETAACLCHRRMSRARELGRVRPAVAEGEVLDLSALRAHIRQLDEVERAAAFYRADPEAPAGRDFSARLEALLSGPLARGRVVSHLP